MIEKKDLQNRCYYNGKCRNTTVAMWLDNEFIFINFNFSQPYIERVKHISDVINDNIDGFIPVSIINAPFEEIKEEKIKLDYNNYYKKMYLNFKPEINGEIWKDIFGYEGLYKISNLGRIKNYNNDFLKQNFSTDKYLLIGLTKDKKRRTFRVHRLVALSFNFIENFNELEVNHKNGIKVDNRCVNLEWSTRKENSNKIYSSGNKVKKLTLEMVNSIKLLLQDKDIYQKDIAKQFNISVSVISEIKSGKKWK